MTKVFPEKLIRLSGSECVEKDGSSSRWTWALPMSAGTGPGLIPGSCSCVPAIEVGRPSFRSWNASCAKGRLMRFGDVSSLQMKYRRESAGQRKNAMCDRGW